MNIQSYAILAQPTSIGTQYRVDGNRSNSIDDSDEVLVSRNGDSWQPTTSLEGNVDRFKVADTMGLWTDKEVSHREGWFWNRRTVVDRPLDGKIDADEVSGLDFHRFGSGSLRVGDNNNAFRLGAEIVDKGHGPTLDVHTTVFPSLRVIGQGDIDRLQSYIDDNSNWQVAGPTPEQICHH
jgi:hypothetical protein